MINPSDFFRELELQNIKFFTGVPDSLLKDLCAFISDNVLEENHIIAANEGAAIGLGIGNYLATGNIPLVYMQNSGLGNSINPLLSIAAEEVYSIPILLIIGWRGKPGTTDEPQHKKQGLVTEDLLKAMQIPYNIVNSDSNISAIISNAVSSAIEYNRPHALLVSKKTFSSYKLKKANKTSYQMNREDAIKLLVDQLEEKDIVVSTTGKTSRELFEYRKELNQGHDKDFLTVGAMGHTSQIALGVALGLPDRDIYCFDGDGSVIMHMGSLAINGTMNCVSNFKHIIINNEAHDSVGGQPTVGLVIDFPKLASSCGYTYIASVKDMDDLVQRLKEMKNHKGRGFLEIKVNKGARNNLGRPTNSPLENKILFERFIRA